MTPVGLLPIAVAGIDIEAMLEGAAMACREYDNEDLSSNVCYQYGALRNLLQQQGKVKPKERALNSLTVNRILGV